MIIMIMMIIRVTARSSRAQASSCRGQLLAAGVLDGGLSGMPDVVIRLCQRHGDRHGDEAASGPGRGPDSAGDSESDFQLVVAGEAVKPLRPIPANQCRLSVLCCMMSIDALTRP